MSLTVNKEAGNYLSSVKNALRILQSFSMDEPEQKVSDLSKSLGLNKSTVSRTMATLASEGFVLKDKETNKYRLGLSLITLSGIVYSNMDLYQESLPVLKKLVDTCGETAHISMLDNNEVIYLQKVDCNHPVRFLTHIGKRNPPHCTSSGKVLLAFSDKEIVEPILAKGLQYYTENTITDSQTFQDHMKKIREMGYSESYEEFLEGVHSVAAPIFDYRGKVVAALSVVGPKQRMQARKIEAIVQQTIHASYEIASRLGYRK